MNILIELSEQGILPDRLVRFGIGLLNRKRLREEHRGSIEALREHQRDFVAMLRKSPIAVDTDTANVQHYEVPPEFFALVLGKHRKSWGPALDSEIIRDAGYRSAVVPPVSDRAIR